MQKDDAFGEALGDYLCEEYGPYRQVLTRLPSHADLFAPVIRALLRLQRVAARTALRSNTPGIRAVAEMTLDTKNQHALRIHACLLLKAIRKELDAIMADMKQCLSQDDQQAIWQDVQDRWHAVARLLSTDTKAPALRLAVDFDDLLARFARPSEEDAAAKLAGADDLSKEVRMFYKRGDAVDVAKPEENLERPHRDLVLDLWRTLEFGLPLPSRIVDFGSGFGRTRHHLYEMARGSRQHHDKVKEIAYVQVDVENLQDAQQREAAFPNQHKRPNSEDQDDKSCMCKDMSEGDLLYHIDPERPQTVCRCYSLHNANRSTLWEQQPEVDRAWPKAKRAVLVNVLHEVPLEQTVVLLANILATLPVGGLLLVYEMQQLVHIEDEYVLWYAEDIHEAFSEVGFAVVCASGRTRSVTHRRWGHPYSLACLLRTEVATPSPEAISQRLRHFWESRSDNLCRRIERTSAMMRGPLVTDSVRVEHFHAVQSLANCRRQLHRLYKPHAS